MDKATVQTILNYVITFLSTGIGATVLTIVIKAIVSAITNIKTKKYSKLTEADKTEIVERVANKIIATIQDGVHIDTDGMIDRATNKRLTVMENKMNEFVEMVNKVYEIVKAQGNVLCELKTPSQGARGHLQELIGNFPNAIGYIPQIEQPILKIKQTESEDNITEQKESTVTY